MQITVDLGTPSGQPLPVKQGRYLVTIREIRDSQTKTGARQFGLCLRIVHGDYAGRTIWANLALTEAAMPRLRAFLQAIGAPETEGKVTLNTRDWLGRKLIIKVGVEQIGGTPKNVVFKFLHCASERGQGPTTNPPRSPPTPASNES